jgi:hypothetical protein
MTPLRAGICGATALTVLFPLAVLFLVVLRAAQWRDLWATCRMVVAAWALVAVAWLVGIR